MHTQALPKSVVSANTARAAHGTFEFSLIDKKKSPTCENHLPALSTIGIKPLMRTLNRRIFKSVWRLQHCSLRCSTGII